MKRLSTFEDIFNKLLQDYRGVETVVEIRQDQIKITNFITTIDRISIKPLSKKQSQKWTKGCEKIGLMIIQQRNQKNTVHIPFILGFNTMNAVFMKKGVIIKTLNMEFIFKRDSAVGQKLA